MFLWLFLYYPILSHLLKDNASASFLPYQFFFCFELLYQETDMLLLSHPLGKKVDLLFTTCFPIFLVSFYGILPWKSWLYLILPSFLLPYSVKPTSVRPLYHSHWKSSSGSPCGQMPYAIDSVHFSCPISNTGHSHLLPYPWNTFFFAFQDTTHPWLSTSSVLTPTSPLPFFSQISECWKALGFSPGFLFLHLYSMGNLMQSHGFKYHLNASNAQV